MKTEHTSGPWTTEATTSSEFVTRAIRGSNDELIAHVGVPGYNKTPHVFESVANARLIAAAPDMLDIVEKVFLHLNGLNATMRACSREYAASPVCRAINEIVSDAAKAYHKATEAKGK